MGPVLKVVRLTNQDERFYQLLGPFLSRRAIVTEIGAPVWDDDGKEWFVAMLGRKVAGFAAIKTVGKHRSLVSAYVLPERRKGGVYTAMLKARLEAVGENVAVKAVATAATVPALKRAGLKVTGAKGKFTILERP